MEHSSSSSKVHLKNFSWYALSLYSIHFLHCHRFAPDIHKPRLRQLQIQRVLPDGLSDLVSPIRKEAQPQAIPGAGLSSSADDRLHFRPISKARVQSKAATVRPGSEKKWRGLQARDRKKANEPTTRYLKSAESPLRIRNCKTILLAGLMLKNSRKKQDQSCGKLRGTLYVNTEFIVGRESGKRYWLGHIS